MLFVRPASEPHDFIVKVRVPGANAIREMINPALAPTRPGPKRKVYGSLAAIPVSALPKLWARALPDLCAAYGRTCAYLGMQIPLGVGQPTVDHFVPKSQNRGLAYKWSNFRLASLIANRCKDELAEFADPFRIADGWFALDVVTYEVRWAGPTNALGAAAIVNTLNVLNEPTFCDARRDHHGWYLGTADDFNRPRGRISFADLQIISPFVARELERQNLRRSGD